MKTKTTRLLSLFLAGLLLIGARPAAFGNVQVGNANNKPRAKYHDNHILVRLDNTDPEEVKADLATRVQVSTVKQLHIERDNSSILELRTATDSEEDAANTLQAIRAMNHHAIKEVTRNIMFYPHINPPNDPDFSAQWPLASFCWPQARNTSYGKQTKSPQLCYLGDYTRPISGESGANVRGFNCTGSTVVPETAEIPAGYPYDPEGDIDFGLSMFITNNGIDLAGGLNWGGSAPMGQLTVMRICDFGGTSASLSAIYTALTYLINNQTTLFGGPIVIACSYGAAYPDTPLWNYISPFADSLVAQGSQLVMSAGDTAGTYTQSPATNTGNTIVVQSSDSNNMPSTKFTQVLGDPCYAPGEAQPCIINGVYYPNAWAGTSFSDQHWAIMIAILMSIYPINATQANNLLMETLTPKKLVPNLAEAIALGNIRKFK